MKTAYELAMERLNKAAPMAKLTGMQKKDIAELESRYKAKIAEREIALKDEVEKAAAKGAFEESAKLEQQWIDERKKLQMELEEKKERIRQGK